MGWAWRPRFFMDLPLLFLFLGALAAKDLAQMGLSLGPGLASAKEGVGLTKGPTLLMMDCCWMFSAVCTCKTLTVSTLSLTSLEAAEYRLLMVKSRT